jgi:hypothetical protein
VKANQLGEFRSTSGKVALMVPFQVRRIMRLLAGTVSVVGFAAIMSTAACADEPVTLMGTIVKWRYPEADIGKSQSQTPFRIGAKA